MILIPGLKLIDLNQNNYDLFIKYIKKIWNTFVSSLFGDNAHVICYGTYVRSFITDNDPCRFSLRIQRIYCSETGVTHSLLPACLIPYSIIPLEVQFLIIFSDEDMLQDICNLFYLDRRAIDRIREVYARYWDFLYDWFSCSVDNLVFIAMNFMKKQFMQMRGNAHVYSPT